MLADLASALAARDPSTAAHCARVTFVSRRLAVWLGWDDRKLRTLEVGAPLHDIGKVTISQALLRKRGPLLPQELEEIRTHPAAGAKLISPGSTTARSCGRIRCHDVDASLPPSAADTERPR